LVSQLKPRARKPQLAKTSQRLTTAEAEIIRKPAERAAHFTIARKPQVYFWIQQRSCGSQAEEGSPRVASLVVETLKIGPLRLL
jgi:hypothetical protein